MPDLEPASALSEHIASVIARECRQAESDDAAWAVCAKRLRDHDARVAASVREPLERRIAELEESLRNCQSSLGEWAKRDIASEQHIAALEVQLASAREAALRELIDRLRAEAGLHSAYDCTVLSMAIEGLLELLPATPQPSVSPAWVLNQLAGHTFPGTGEAHDFMKACLRADRKEVP